MGDGGAATRTTAYAARLVTATSLFTRSLCASTSWSVSWSLSTCACRAATCTGRDTERNVCKV